jgi:hypothetical protein
MNIEEKREFRPLSKEQKELLVEANANVEMSGLDLFISNLSRNKTKQFIKVLNRLCATGLKWKINQFISSHPIHNLKNKVVITLRYAPVKTTINDINDLFVRNRNIMNMILEQMGFTDAEYTGCEYYINVPAS